MGILLLFMLPMNKPRLSQTSDLFQDTQPVKQRQNATDTVPQ